MCCRHTEKVENCCIVTWVYWKVNAVGLIGSMLEVLTILLWHIWHDILLMDLNYSTLLQQLSYWGNKMGSVGPAPVSSHLRNRYRYPPADVNVFTNVILYELSYSLIFCLVRNRRLLEYEVKIKRGFQPLSSGSLQMAVLPKCWSTVYRPTWYHIVEDLNFQHHCENLKSWGCFFPIET